MDTNPAAEDAASPTIKPTSRFASATAMTRADANTWVGEITDGWDVGGNANGGYLLALAGRALLGATQRRDPITITAHYLAPGRPGPVQIDPKIHKAGRRFTTASGVLRQGDTAVISVMGSFGDLAALAGADGADGGVLPTENVGALPTENVGVPPVEHIDGSPPELPPLNEASSNWPTGDFIPAIARQVDMQLHPDDQRFALGDPSGNFVIRGWFSLLDDEPIDTTTLLLAVDAFPPTAFNGNLPVAWTPTIELTAHIRAVPADGPLRCAFRSRFLQGSMIETDGEVWDRKGRLCAQSRQLALVPQGIAVT